MNGRGRRRGFGGSVRWLPDAGIGATAPEPTAGEEYRRNLAGELLPVTCWCEHRIVWVPPDEIAAGLTRHCRRQTCRMIDHRRREPDHA